VHVVEDRQPERDRCLYWAVWHSAPDGAQTRVVYDIAGEGRGGYLRPAGAPVILYRWDTKRSVGSSLTQDRDAGVDPHAAARSRSSRTPTSLSGGTSDTAPSRRARRTNGRTRSWTPAPTRYDGP